MTRSERHPVEYLDDTPAELRWTELGRDPYGHIAYMVPREPAAPMRFARPVAWSRDPYDLMGLSAVDVARVLETAPTSGNELLAHGQHTFEGFLCAGGEWYVLWLRRQGHEFVQPHRWASWDLHTNNLAVAEVEARNVAWLHESQTRQTAIERESAEFPLPIEPGREGDCAARTIAHVFRLAAFAEQRLRPQGMRRLGLLPVDQLMSALRGHLPPPAEDNRPLALGNRGFGLGSYSDERPLMPDFFADRYHTGDGLHVAAIDLAAVKYGGDVVIDGRWSSLDIDALHNFTYHALLRGHDRRNTQTVIQGYDTLELVRRAYASSLRATEGDSFLIWRGEVAQAEADIHACGGRVDGFAVHSGAFDDYRSTNPQPRPAPAPHVLRVDVERETHARQALARAREAGLIRHARRKFSVDASPWLTEGALVDRLPGRTVGERVGAALFGMETEDPLHAYVRTYTQPGPDSREPRRRQRTARRGRVSAVPQPLTRTP